MIIKPEVSKAENKKKKNKISKSTSGICEGKKVQEIENREY